MQIKHLQRVANEARGLAIDAVEKCSSGHLGLPLGCAEMGAVLFTEGLQFSSENPKWINRDRFILSAGHGSLFLYTWLHLSGYAISLEDLRAFRQMGSITPGHPEFGETRGVEATTGPLGQGVGNAVGYAISGKKLALLFEEDKSLYDSHIICLAGDGCLQEGVARESIAFAGHMGLDNLILIYDSNEVTLDAMASVTQSENQAQYFQSLGWEVFEVDGHHLEKLADALRRAKEADNGTPKVIIAKTLIGKGVSEVAGTQKAHGESGAKFFVSAKKSLGLPAESFFVSDETRKFFAEQGEKRSQVFADWLGRFEVWKQKFPERLTLLEAKSLSFSDLLKKFPEFPNSYNKATRDSCGESLNRVAQDLPFLLSGSADLFGSTKNYLDGQGDFSRGNVAGKNLWFGIREHSMAAICNGIAYDGFFQICQATFLAFADYLRPSLRLAALAKLPSVYLFTHDSVGVGEDGPTHQPVETVSGLRVIPNLNVIRPADAEETAAALALALTTKKRPSALILTRQKVSLIEGVSSDEKRLGVSRGGYIIRREKGVLKGIFLATGSEVQVALAAVEDLGAGYRVVSLPCLRLFAEQEKSYQEEVLPSSCLARVAVEAGVSDLWWRYVGDRGKVVSIDSFGLSAPGEEVFMKLGIHRDSLVKVMQDLES